MLDDLLRICDDLPEPIEVAVDPRELDRSRSAIASLAADPTTNPAFAAEARRLEPELERLREADDRTVSLDPTDVVLLAYAHLAAARAGDRSRAHRRQSGRLLRLVRDQIPTPACPGISGP